MSEFLPEGFGSPSAPQTSDVANPTASDADVEMMKRVLSAAASRPNLIPGAFLSYIIDYIQTSNLVIPIGQVFGFQNFVSTQVAVSKAAAVSTFTQTLASGAAAVTATGPTVTLGAAGLYLLNVSIDIDSTNMQSEITLSTGDSVLAGKNGISALGSFSKLVPYTAATDGVVISSVLSIGPNTTGGPATGTISNAALSAIRYANP